MGALTDSRKRCSVDHCLLISPHPLFDPSKKSKNSSSPSYFSPLEPPQQRPPAAGRCKFPPPFPLRRAVHAPQRIRKPFGLGSSDLSPRTPPDWGSRKARDAGMGGLFSRLYRVARGGDYHGGLGLEDYKRLVDVQEGRSAVSSSFSVSDLTFLTRKDEGPLGIHVLNRKVEDARTIVLESMPSVGEEKASRKRIPFYKKLYNDVSRRYEDKLRSLESEVKFTEKKKSTFHLTSEAQWKKSEEDLRELFSPLTYEEEDIVFDAMQGGNSREVLVSHEASNIEITRVVLQCLSQGAWLNDEVINLYLELLKEREKREPKRFLKCHFFNTFFYKKLISGRNGYDFKAVRRWTSKKKLGYGLIECDKIFVPIHKDIHWCLAVINVKEKSLTYLDSLSGMDTATLRVLARYFMDEVKDKDDKQIDTMSWKQATVNDLPLQQNGWDCGMFMLKYADFYSRGLSLCFSQEDMPYFRKRTAMEILRLRAE